jgi:hypothetical protein
MLDISGNVTDNYIPVEGILIDGILDKKNTRLVSDAYLGHCLQVLEVNVFDCYDSKNSHMRKVYYKNVYISRPMNDINQNNYLISADYFYEYFDENNSYFIKPVKLYNGTIELLGRVKIINVIIDKDHADDSFVELVSYSNLESVITGLLTKDNKYLISCNSKMSI